MTVVVLLSQMFLQFVLHTCHSFGAPCRAFHNTSVAACLDVTSSHFTVPITIQPAVALCSDVLFNGAGRAAPR